MVAVFGDPARSGEVAVVDAAGAFAVLVRVKTEHDADDLGPLRTFLSCVEKAKVEREVLSIILGEIAPLRRLIGKHCGGDNAAPILLL
jgi:hypothetical protein